ncbi:hypothetical protein Aduo_015657 [Ancylostoma duodenale]
MAGIPSRYVKIDIVSFFGTIRILGHYVSVHRNTMMALLNREPGVDPKRHREEAPIDAPTTSRDNDEVQIIEHELKAIMMEPMEEEQQ